VKDFSTIKKAKNYLADRIAAEAMREGVSLSEVERKMLYFSETGWTLPDMAAVGADFDRDYDQDEYEQKIASLFRNIERHDQAHPDEREAWDDAVLKLSEGDHYLLVLLNPSLSASSPTVRPPHDRLKLWLTAFGIVFGFFALVALGDWLCGPGFPDWIFDKNRGGLLVLAAALVWLFRSQLKAMLNVLVNRK